jgi:hypothetical protein
MWLWPHALAFMLPIFRSRCCLGSNFAGEEVDSMDISIIRVVAAVLAVVVLAVIVYRRKAKA